MAIVYLKHADKVGYQLSYDSESGVIDFLEAESHVSLEGLSGDYLQASNGIWGFVYKHDPKFLFHNEIIYCIDGSLFVKTDFLSKAQASCPIYINGKLVNEFIYPRVIIHKIDH